MRTRATSVAERARQARFQRLVERTLAALPGWIRDELENIEIVVAVEPTMEQLGADGDSDSDLFGLYEGTPRSERDSSYSMVMPDRIVLFRGPLERAFPEPAAMMREVRLTVLHELAHHFGFDEDRMEELGLA